MLVTALTRHSDNGNPSNETHDLRMALMLWVIWASTERSGRRVAFYRVCARGPLTMMASQREHPMFESA